MFENLRKLVLSEAEARKAETAFYILHGFREFWNEEQKTEGDAGLLRYSTKTRALQYQRGEITRGKAVEYATRRACKEIDASAKKDLEKLDAAALAPDLDLVSIYVNWTRSATWGYNPHAEIFVNGCGPAYIGSASGCGYDKESAAIASALRPAASVNRALYIAAEKALEEGKTPKILSSHYCIWGDILGYGCPGFPLPCFEGGVGVSAFRGIFENLGYTWENTHSTKTHDSYLIRRKGV